MAKIMRRRRTVAAWGAYVLVLAGGVAPALAQPTSLHDIPWYMAHDAARTATLNVCRSDHRFSHDVDCANAETATDRLWGQRAAGGAAPGQAHGSSSLFGDLVSPQYWADNRLNRIGVIASCKAHIAFYKPETCAAAQQGDALDNARRSR